MSHCALQHFHTLAETLHVLSLQQIKSYVIMPLIKCLITQTGMDALMERSDCSEIRPISLTCVTE